MILQKISYVIGEKRYFKLSAIVKLVLFYFRNIISREESYITCSGKRDGAGAQALAVMSTMLFSDIMHIKYIHTPFVKLQHNYANDANWEKKWENFFNLGKGESKIDDNGLQIKQEIPLEENPLKIKKQSNTLFILRHCHIYTDLFPNQYSRIKDKLVQKYYESPKNEYELHYDPQKVNIAVHIRRGDVNADNEFKDKFTENPYIENVISNILEVITAYGIESTLSVYSEGNLADFKYLEKFNPRFFLDISPFTTFHNLVYADVLVMSKSTFSYAAALLSNGIIFYIPFRHTQQEGWIKINGNAEFNTRYFSKKLHHIMPCDQKKACQSNP